MSTSDVQTSRSSIGDPLVQRSWLSRLREGAFGVAFALSKETTLVALQTMVAFAVLELLQMVSFPLALVNDSPSIKPIAAAMDYLRTGAFGRVVDTIGFTAMLTIVLVVVIGFLGLVVSVAIRFIHDAPQSKALLRLLRALASLLTTVLFLPMAGVIMRVFTCHDSDWAWQGASPRCHSVGHTVLVVLVALVLLLWVATSLLVMATLVDNNPASRSAAAKVHGRVDALVILIKLSLSFAWRMSHGSLEAHEQSAALGLAILLVLTGIGWLLAFVYFLPLMEMRLNALIVASASIYLWCSLTALATLALPDASFDPGLSMTLGSVAVGTAAYLLALRRVDRVRRLSITAVKGSSTLLEVWGRLKLRVLLQNPTFDRFARSQSGPISGKAHGLPLGLLVHRWRQKHPRAERAEELDPAASSGAWTKGRYQATVGGASGTGHGQRGGTGEGQHRGPVAGQGSSRVPAGGLTDPLTERGGTAGGDYHQDHEEHERQLDDNNLANALVCLDQAVSAYRLLVQAFPSSELAAIRAATFWQMYSQYLYPEMLALRRAASLNSGIDTQYHVFMRLKQTESLSSGRTSKATASMSVIDRLMVDQQTKQIAQLQQSSYRTTSRLWQCLSDNVVDFHNVAEAGLQLNQELDRLDVLFTAVINSGAASTTLLRSYAGFLKDQRSSPQQAMELMNKADRIDEAKSRRRGRPLRHCHFGMPYDGRLDENDERSAVMMVSGDVANLGEVLQVSVGACRLLGARAPQELVGTTVHDIVPQPLREVHANLMAGFRDAVESKVMGRPRMLFVSTLSGSLVPAWTRIAEAPPDADTAAPRFMAVMEPVLSREQHLIIGTKDENYRVFGGTAGALTTLGISVESLRHDQEPIPVTNFIPTVSTKGTRVAHCTAEGVLIERGSEPGASDDERVPPARRRPSMTIPETAEEDARTFRRLSEAVNAARVTATPDGPMLLPGTNNAILSHSHHSIRLQLADLRHASWQADLDTIIPIQCATPSGMKVWKLFLGNMQCVRVGTLSFSVLRWTPLEQSSAAQGARHSFRLRNSIEEEAETGGLRAALAPGAHSHLPAAPAHGSDLLTGLHADDDSLLESLDEEDQPPRQADPTRPAGTPAAPPKAEGSGRPVGVAMVSPAGPRDALGAGAELPEPANGSNRSMGSSLAGGSGGERRVAFEPSPSQGNVLKGRRGGGVVATGPAVAAESAGGGDDGWQLHKAVPSRSSIGTSSTTRLTRALKAQTSRPVVEVTHIRLVILAVSLACLGIGGLDTLWLSETSTDLRNLLTGVVLSGERVIETQAASMALYGIVSSSGGVTDGVYLPAASEQERLRHAALGLQEYNDAIKLADTSYGKTAGAFENQVPLALIQLREMAGVHGITAELDEPPPPNTTHGLTNVSLADFPCLTYEQCSRYALSFLAHGAVDFWLEAADALRISSIGTGRELSHNESHSLAMEIGAEHLVIEYSRDASTLDLQLAEVAKTEYVATATSLPLSQYAGAYAGILLDISNRPTSELGYFYRDLRDCIANDAVLTGAMQEALELRATELSERFPKLTAELIIAGTIAFVLTAALQSWILASLISRIAHRTRSALRLLLLVPRMTCQTMHHKATKRFQQLVAQQEAEEQMSQSESDSDAGRVADCVDERAAVIKGLSSRGLANSPSEADDHPEDDQDSSGESKAGKMHPSHSDLDRRLLAAQLATSAQPRTTPATSPASSASHTRRSSHSAVRRTNVRLRPHADSSNFVCRHVAKFTAPTLLILVWLGSLALFQAVQHQRLKELAHRSIVTALMSRRTFQYYMRLTDVTFAEDGPGRAEAALHAAELDNQLMELSHIFENGGSVELPATGARISINGISPKLRHHDLFVSDGCLKSSDARACREAVEGAMAAGIDTAIERLVNTGRRLVARLPEVQHDPAVPLVYGFYPGPLKELQRAAGMVVPHLTDALWLMLVDIQGEMLDVLEQVESVSLRITIAFDALMILWVVFGIYSASGLARPLHSARSLLAVVPADVRDGVSPLRLAIRDMASDPAMTVRSVTFHPATLRLHVRSDKRRCGCRRASNRGRVGPARSQRSEGSMASDL